LRGLLRAWRKVLATYRRVYDSRHLQADCQESGSAPKPYARGNRVQATFAFYKAAGVDSPEIHDVVLVVAAVDEDLRSVDEEASQQQDGDLDRVWAAIHQVAVEHVRVVRRRQPVLTSGQRILTTGRIAEHFRHPTAGESIQKTQYKAYHFV